MRRIECLYLQVLTARAFHVLCETLVFRAVLLFFSASGRSIPFYRGVTCRAKSLVSEAVSEAIRSCCNVQLLTVPS